MKDFVKRIKRKLTFIDVVEVKTFYKSNLHKKKVGNFLQDEGRPEVLQDYSLGVNKFSLKTENPT